MKTILILSAITIAGCSLAMAQNDRSFVAINGNDFADCSKFNPCATFARAITRTNSGGEIDALDSSDYGPVVIDRSVTIDGGTGIASINANTSCGNFFAVAICSLGQNVILRNLSIGNIASPNNSNSFFSAIVSNPGLGSGIMRIENVAMSSGSNCVDIVTGTVDIKGAQIRNCGGDGVKLHPGTTGFLDNVTISGVFGNGVSAYGAAIIRNSSIVRSSVNGVYAANAGGQSNSISLIVLENVLVAFNQFGVYAVQNKASLELSNVTITSNGTGISPGGAVVSLVNNRIYGNTTNGAPTLSVYQK